MCIGTLKQILGLCSIINLVVLLFWFIMMAFANKAIYKIHSRWFKISEEHFNAIHYTGIMYYKLAIFVFFIIPYFVLRIVG